MSRRIDVNAASGSELAEVLELSTEVGDRIVEYRARHGGIRAVDDLAGVEGIDSAALGRMRERLIVGLPAGAATRP